MRKRKILHVLLLALLILKLPTKALAAFDAPAPDPLSFALANLISFPDYLILTDHEPGRWYLASGGARLFGMPEIQPFGIRFSGPGLDGRWQLMGDGLQSGTYSEMRSGLGYERLLSNSLRAGLEVYLLQVSIKGYGGAWSNQINARINWRPQPRLELAFSWINLTDARLGVDRYPLPRRIAIGGMFSPISRAQLFLELEQDARYALSPRFGIGFQLLDEITLLLGMQSDPDIVSAGLSSLIGPIRASAAYQYHPDLGLSQCYGIIIVF